MNRRSFLKGVAIFTAAPLVRAPDFRMIVPAAVALPGEEWFATIRELSAYDIERDLSILQWDVLSIDDIQLSVLIARRPESY